MPVEAVIVSCDLIAHGKEELVVQCDRVRTINDLVRQSIQEVTRGVIWASGGDGGHVVFLSQNSLEAAMKLLERLWVWSRKADAPLRITGHWGAVEEIEGADGRIQLVGNGINQAGALVTFGTDLGIAVSESFRKLVEERQLEGVRFHDERAIYLKHFFLVRLSLMSVGEKVKSQWGVSATHDKQLLREALEVRQYKDRWSLIYHAKRLLEINSDDVDATDALAGIDPSELTFAKAGSDTPLPNLFFARMDKGMLRDCIKAAPLLERQDGEVICRHGDDGDTMFVVLNGQAGVIFPNATSAEGQDVQPRIGPGEIAGELAYYLRRKRTATLQAIGKTALLAFKFEQLETVFKNSTNGRERLKEINRDFFERRVLEHLCNKANYFSSLKDFRRDPWNFIHGSKTATFDWQQYEFISTEIPFLKKNGLYILASGRLETQFGQNYPAKVLKGEELPIMFVDFPGHLVSVKQQYRIAQEPLDEPMGPGRIGKGGIARIVYVPMVALQQLGQDVFRSLVEGIKKIVNAQFRFDVFISYNHNDTDIAKRWKLAMEQSGLHVFLSETTPMQHFKPEIAQAILEARTFLALISANTRRPGDNESWVEREITYRKAFFDVGSCNILPVRLTGGDVEVIGDGFTPIDAIGEGRERGAMQEAIKSIVAVRDGWQPMPFSTKRRELNIDL